ncbi:Oligopeptide/dipeptide transporter, C-terminal region [Bryocella elongata]|uniref:Oligopeptide/dipeptide transporter, C-terminal region n=1 Tax=Bryocella elongata TaxID=863522 RepID=A0A1H6BKT6_9BACT|nr:ABC transporter ATP-binding protein [Bryocella elongata]SEG61319.1 Oligopeptide/dipeptide transporter, C-terminal region [Bryocella elongata]
MSSNAPAPPNPLLEVTDLRVAFGKSEAVRGISFSLNSGETLGLVGESGSGKSATSLALMRLLPSTAHVSGSVKLYSAASGGAQEALGYRRTGASAHWVRTEAGLVDVGLPEWEDAHPERSHPRATIGYSVYGDLLTTSERDMRRSRGREIAMIFQEPMTALNPVMTIGRQIAECVLAHAPKTARAEVRERVLAAMREVALPEPERRIDDYPHQFSGGQRQRIVIAMALVNKPRLVIADEPTTALDVTVQAEILALLRRLRKEHGLSMLFISHDLAVVGQIADRIAVMRRGEIVEMGSSRDVLRNPQHEYTQSLLAAVPTMATDRNRPLGRVARQAERERHEGPGTDHRS